MNIEEFIYNTYKDEAIIGKTFKREIMEKYNLTQEEARNIFVRINNYQIENFGERLDINKTFYPPYSSEELSKKRTNANARKYSRRSSRVWVEYLSIYMSIW